MKFVLDFDDLCSQNIHKLDALATLTKRHPDLRVTLFTIPNRITKDEIAEVKAKYPWAALAPHGWEHTRGECLAWTLTEAQDKIGAAREMGLDAPVFRAPAWLINGACYQVAEELDLTIASHADYHLPSSKRTDDFEWSGVPQYIYNLPGGKLKGVRAAHGHITPVAGNHVLDMLKDGRLFFTMGDSFMWPWEAAVQVNE